MRGQELVSRPKLGDKKVVAQSAIFIPVPEADAVIGSWRAVHDPKARSGVPAHITLVVPWLPPREINEAHFNEVDSLLAGQPAFDYCLEKVQWFGDRVLWLAPSPAEPFKRLTWLLATHFGTPPWQGEFPDVVPHLTVGLAGCALGSTLADAAADIAEKLPISCRAREVDVMCGDGSRWSVVHRTQLADEPAR
jgi:2'-5' RNA ligase